MTDVGGSVLAALVAPHRPQDFLTQHWPDKAFVSHGAAERLPAFLRAPELTNVEALSARYRGWLRFTSGRKYQQMIAIDQVHAISLYRMGLTVQFADIAPCVRQVPAELARLEAELGINPGAAQASVFCSPLAEGLSVHFDSQDLFSVQLAGEKRFHFAPVNEISCPSGTQFVPGTEAFDDLYPQASQGFPDAAGIDFATVEMKPGSVLFIPRGTWHHTESQGESVSVSIALGAPSAAECVLEQLRMLMLQDPAWRRPLYGGWGGGAMREEAKTRAARLLAALPGLTRSLGVEDLMASLAPRAQRLTDLAPTSRFQKTPHSRIALSPPSVTNAYSYEILSLYLCDPVYGERMTMRLEVAPKVAAVFRWLAASRKPFAARELAANFPALPFAEHCRILQTAATGGLLKLLWFPPLVGPSMAAADKEAESGDTAVNAQRSK